MNVTVCWISYEPGTIYAGYWDQSLLADLLERTLWHPGGAVTFDEWHIDSPDSDWPDVDGVVAVVAGRHNAKHVEILNRDLARYQWVIVVVTGDEEARFPYAQLNHPHRRVWGMGARKGSPVDVPLGSGYSPGFPALVSSNPAPGPGRLDLFLCAQDTHPRRHQAFDAARNAVDPARRLVIATDEFLADGSEAKGGLSREQYAWSMGDTKLAPCPSGPESVDSFRLYEALEAGAIPLADGVSPKASQGDWWEWVFGGPVPFLVMDDWRPLPAVAETLLRGWPGNAARISAWWQAHKRALAYKMETHVRELTGTQPDYLTPDDMITVVLPTCPIPSHPDTAMIEEVVESVRAQLPRAEIIISCDGVRPTMAHRAAEYEEFLFRLTRLCQKWHNVLPVILDGWHHQANSTRAALAYVTTPLMLFQEHDCPLTGEIDWAGLCHVVNSGAVNMIRLHHETAIGEPHKHMMLDEPEIHIGQSDEFPKGVPIVRTVQWSQRPHLASTRFYRERVLPLFPTANPSSYLEWLLHGEVTHGIEDGMEKTWERWKTAVYYPPGGNIQRSLHLDGRRTGATASEDSTDDSVEAFRAMRERK